jgi:CubicO group peptidase (beta-lactamase class C family)
MSVLRRAAMTGALLMGSVLVPTAASAADDNRDVTSSESAQIDGWITERMSAHDLPGAAVVVVRDGEVVHLSGYGNADPGGRPVTADTPFLIGSASKPFTAMVVQQLVEEGRLSLDEPVAPYLEPITGEFPDGFEEATVGQLLNHTGGLSMEVGLAGTVEIHEGDDALDHRVADLLSEPLSSPPGNGFEYSNAGAQLLAAVTEQVTGRPFAEQLRERVFEPLGMSASFASADDPRGNDLATGHRRWFGQWRPTDLPYDNAGVAMGYVGSTAADLASFLQAHLDGDPAVPASAAQIAERRVVPTGWDIPAEGGYGLGWFVDELGGEQIVSHSGSLAHFTAHLVMAPDADLGVAVLSNASAFVTSGHEGQYDLSLSLTRMLLDQDPQPAGPNVVMTYLAPVALWSLVVLLAVAVPRFFTRTLPRWRAEPRPFAGQRWIRRLALPAAGYLALGAALWMTVPLEAGRHFAPDIGWGATVLAYAAPAWVVLRTVAALTRPRRPGLAARTDSRHEPLSAAEPAQDADDRFPTSVR